MIVALVTHGFELFRLGKCCKNDLIFLGRFSSDSMMGHMEYHNLLCEKEIALSMQIDSNRPLGSPLKLYYHCRILSMLFIVVHHIHIYSVILNA